MRVATGTETGAGTRSDLAGAALHEAFWELVLADEELLRAQFDEVVSAGDPARARPDLPPLAPRPTPEVPGRPSFRLVVHRPVDGRQEVPMARQRGPPTGR